MPLDLDLPAAERPALIAPAPARTTPPGSGLSCLRAWRRARDQGKGDDAREAALSGSVATISPLPPASEN